jgi:hypothetical protein
MRNRGPKISARRDAGARNNGGKAVGVAFVAFVEQGAKFDAALLRVKQGQRDRPLGAS